MRFLVLSRFPPGLLNGGAAIRNNQHIAALRGLGEVDVVTITSDSTVQRSSERTNHDPVFVKQQGPLSLRKAIWHKLLKRSPFIEPRFLDNLDPRALDWIHESAKTAPYDLAIVEELALAHYIPFASRHAHTVVYDAHNVEGPLRWEISKMGNKTIRPLDKMRGRRIFFEEKRAVKKADLIWTCSNLDSAIIRQHYGQSVRTSAIPNAIDLDLYPSMEFEKTDSLWSLHPLRMLYLGSYSYAPNAEAALTLINEVLPLVRLEAPECELLIVGRDPTKEMRDAASGVENVTITGPVRDTRDYLREPCILTLPIRLGSGTRLKILEAFAAQVPIVTTKKGCEGIDGVDEKHLLIRDEPAEIASAVLELHTNSERRKTISRNAYNLANTSYSWRHVKTLVSHEIDQIQKQN